MTTNTLSDKRGRYVGTGYYSYLEEDVKDFIQKLKDKTFWVNGHSDLCEQIDKLAGDALIHSPHASPYEDTPEDKTSTEGSGTHSPFRGRGRMKTTDNKGCTNPCKYCGEPSDPYFKNPKVCERCKSKLAKKANQARQTNRPFQKDRGDVLVKSLKRSGGLDKVKTAETSYNKECANCGEPEHIHPYSFGLGKSCDKFMIKKLKGEKKK